MVLNKDWLGYEVMWQGQHPWPALPMAMTMATPLLGLTKYALWVKPGHMPVPPAVRVNFRIFSKPRYM